MTIKKIATIVTLAGAVVAGLSGCGSPEGDRIDEGVAVNVDGNVLLRVPDDPTVTFKVWFRVGSQDDPAGKEGLAYLTSQMISDGGTRERSLEEILDALYPLASAYRVSVDREMTVLTGRTHLDNVDRYIPLLTDAYLRPGFRQEDFDRIKSDTLNYLRNALRFQQDEELGKAAFYGFVFEGTPYAHPVEGTVSGIEAITLDDVRGFYAEHYTRANAVLALGGGFDEALRDRFLATRSELPEGPDATPPVIAAPEIAGRELLLVQKPGADASISFGFPIDVLRGEREFYALWIANSWLGEHRNSSSHLYQVIREARGMNYGDYSYIEAFPNGGRRSVPPTHVGRHHQVFEVWIRTLPNDQALFALRAALRELDRLVQHGMTQEEFDLTRSFLDKYVLHFADTTSGRLGYAVDDRFYGIDAPGHLATFRRMMNEITLDEVNAAIRKHLKTDRMRIAIATGEAETLKAAVAADAPSPMTYRSEKPEAILKEDKEIAVFPLGIPAESIRVVPVEQMFE